MLDDLAAARHPLVNATICWVSRMVVGQGLCPWAVPVVRDGTLHFATTEADDLQSLVFDFVTELERLINTPPDDIATILLIHTGDLLTDFEDYLDALHLLDAALIEAHLDGEVQLASFHPQYRFEGPPDDVAHYTNRSPAPMFHLIREVDVSAAVASHPDIESIPRRNAEHMRSLGRAYLETLLRECKEGR